MKRIAERIATVEMMLRRLSPQRSIIAIKPGESTSDAVERCRSGGVQIADHIVALPSDVRRLDKWQQLVDEHHAWANSDWIGATATIKSKEHT